MWKLANDDWDFQNSVEELAEKRRQEEHDDFHHAFAGRDVGRMTKFLPRGARDPKSKERRERDWAIHTALAILLANAEYAALYNNVSDLVDRAESVTEKALREAEQELADAEQALSDILDNANRLPNGTAVFRDADGRVWTEDGKLIEREALDSIVWRDGAPSYEEHLRRKAAADEARKRLEEIRRYQVDILGHARDRLNDTNEPPSMEELEQIQKDILEKAPPGIRSELETEASATPDTDQTSFDVGTPKL